MSIEELDARLELVLDALPETHEGQEKRKHALTRADMKLIIDAIKVVSENQGCNLKLTSEQAQDLTSMIKERKRILALLGAGVIGVLSLVGQKVIDATDPAIWKRLIFWH